MGKVKRMIASLFIAALALPAGSVAFAAETPSQGDVVLPEDGRPYATDEVIVVYKDGASDANIHRYIKKSKAQHRQTVMLDDQQKMSLLHIEEGASLQHALKACADSPVVDYVQPNYIYRLPKKISTKAAESEGKTPDDPFWHLDNINLSGAKKRYNAFASAKKTSKVLVAVLDTGVDMDHEDLQGSLNKNLSKKIDKDGELSPLTGDSDIFDGHGTHVFGIIGATADNHLGTKGVASTVLGDKLEIAAIDIFNFYDDKADEGDGDGIDDYDEYGADTASIVAGLDYAIEIGADVINLSIGSFSKDLAEKNAIQRCIDAGITVVSAAGNEGTAHTSYPSDYDHVLSVVASDQNSKATDWSNYGKFKDITAPGEAIYSTIPSTLTKYAELTGQNKGVTYETEKYGLMDGTSMAAPIVTATAAILYALAPTATLTRIENAICKTAKDIGPKGKDTFTGHGLLDAGKAVQYIIAPTTPTGYRVRLSTSSKTSSTNYRRVQLQWNTMLRATGYRIAYRPKGAATYTYKHIPAGQNSISLKLDPGKTYTFILRGYRDIGGMLHYSLPTATKTITTLKAPTLKKVTQTSAGNHKLTWSNINGESGYQVLRRKGKTGKWITVSWNSAGKTSYIDKNSNKKSTYDYKVRAYKKVTVNGKTKKVYGPWSGIRSK